MPKKLSQYKAMKVAKIAGLSLLLQGCLTNAPKAVISDASVTEPKIAGDAVTSDKIQNGTIQTVDLADASVTTAKLASGINVTGGSSTWSSTLAVTGASTFTGAVTGAGNFTLGDASTDAHTVNGSMSLANGSMSLANGSMSLAMTSTSTGAGTVALVTNALTASPTVASDSNFKGISNTLTGSPTAAVNAASSFVAAENLTSISPTVAQANLTGWGAVNIARLATPFAASQLVGTFGRAQNADVDTLTTGIGVDGEILNSTNGTITNAYAFHAKLDNQAGGTVTNYAGLYLQDPTDPTNAAPTAFAGGGVQYGIFSDGAATVNFFEGRLGIGAGKTNPAAVRSIDAAGDINTDGCMMTGGAGFQGVCVSDRRVKKDIHDFPYGLNEIIKLRPRAYKHNGLAGTDDNGKAVGFVAQELEEVIPEYVVKSKVKLHSGDKEDTEIRKVNYSNFIYVAINAIKELYAKWESDHRDLAQQKQQIASLERKIELENIALRSENKALKDRLEKIEQALALASPAQSLQKGRKLASSEKALKKASAKE